MEGDEEGKREANRREGVKGEERAGKRDEEEWVTATVWRVDDSHLWPSSNSLARGGSGRQSEPDFEF